MSSDDDDTLVTAKKDDDTIIIETSELALGEDDDIDRLMLEQPAESVAGEALLEVHGAGRSDCGRRRTENQDAMLVLPKRNLFAVADGIGGRAAGEIASELAVEVLRRALARNGTSPGHSMVSRPRKADELVRAMEIANQVIYRRAQEDEDCAGMGTTLTALRIAPGRGRGYLAHVGDTRCYRLRDGAVELLTRDHTRGEMLGEVGPLAGHLSRAIGVEPFVAIDCHVFEVHDGDLFMLSSDGLTNNVPLDEIVALLTKPDDLGVRAQALVKLANDNGSKDNITVVLASLSTRTLD